MDSVGFGIDLKLHYLTLSRPRCLFDLGLDGTGIIAIQPVTVMAVRGMRKMEIA